MEDIDARVRDIIAKQFDKPAGVLTPETTIAGDLSADSLDRVELIITLEQEFDIEIYDEEFEHAATVGEIIACVKRKFAETV